MISNLSLIVYTKGESIPQSYIDQVIGFQSEEISEYFKDPYTFDIGFVLDDEQRVLGVGLIRVIAEFKMQLSPSLSNPEKAIIVRDLMNEAISRRPCGEIVAFISQGGLSYELFLQKHFDFNKIKGTPMKWEV
jgi:hypothetical protein